MLHWDKIQIGDVLEWHTSDRSQYQIVGKTKQGIGWIITFRSLQENKDYPDYREGSFGYARLITLKSKDERILEKIKYLDERYKLNQQKKKQHESISLGLGDNNLQQGESVRYLESARHAWVDETTNERTQEYLSTILEYLNRRG